MKIETIATILVDVDRYPLHLEPDGKRIINRKEKEWRTIEFKFKGDALKQIVSRLGSPVLRIDHLELHFDYKQNMLVGAHFEDDENLYIIKDSRKFINDCMDNFVAIRMMELIGYSSDALHTMKKEEKKQDNVIDEFELEEGHYIDEEDQKDGRDRLSNDE